MIFVNVHVYLYLLLKTFLVREFQLCVFIDETGFFFLENVTKYFRECHLKN